MKTCIFVILNTNHMKTEIILFDNHFLYLQALCCLLDKKGFDKKYNYQYTVNPDELENLVSEKSEMAVLNILGLSTNDAFTLVEQLMTVNPELKIIILT